MMIQRLKQALFGGLVALATALPTSAQEPGLRPNIPCPPLTIEGVADQKPVCDYISDVLREKPGLNLDVDASTTFASNYVGRGGFVIGEGPVQQGLVTVTRTNNFCKGDNITVKGWANYDYGNNEWVEVDSIAEYTVPVKALARLLDYSSDWTDQLTIGFQNWYYPGRVLGSKDNDDNALDFRWLHSSRINIEGEHVHIFGDKDVCSGDYFAVRGFKESPLGELIGCKWYATPMVEASYDLKFFGENGFNFRGEITTGLRKGAGYLEGFLGAQKVFNENNPIRKDAFYSGVRLGVKF